MFILPIVSMNISESMKKFLKRMVGNKEYKNSSNVMRTALVRLMSEEEDTVGAVAQDKTLISFGPSIVSSVLVTVPISRIKLDKKINRLEMHYRDCIVNKSVFIHHGFKTITYILENTMVNIQSFITEFNAIENIQSFRYSIHETKE